MLLERHEYVEYGKELAKESLQESNSGLLHRHMLLLSLQQVLINRC